MTLENDIRIDRLDKTKEAATKLNESLDWPNLIKFRKDLNLSSTDANPLFTNLNSGQSYKCIQTAWMHAKKSCNKEHIRIHDLRHTFASILINNGATIYEVQRLLGHSSVNVTQRYAHLLPNKLCETAD